MENIWKLSNFHSLQFVTCVQEGVILNPPSPGATNTPSSSSSSGGVAVEDVVNRNVDVSEGTHVRPDDLIRAVRNDDELEIEFPDSMKEEDIEHKYV